MLSARGAAAVWLRNATVWRAHWKTSLVGSIGEPLLYVLGLGYGLGTVVPDIGGVPYLRFVAPGLMLSSVMQSATIESTYMAFTKMQHQRVFASMLLAPLTLGDVLLGEILWAATKGLICGGAVLALLLAAGVGEIWPGVLAVPLILLAGFIFASLGLVVASIARGYDSFNYYFTLFIAPMFFFSGIFFPVRGLGDWAYGLSWAFPLTPLVAIARGLLTGAPAGSLLAPLGAAALFAAAAFAGALTLVRRRFMP